MSFSTRNAYYLRASNYRVIPLFLYLDERHVDWMTDRVLQLVIAELQPKMSGLLMYGRAEKKHKVFVERGEGYQYCYFLRTTTKTEVVLLKQKTYNLRLPSPPPPPAPILTTPSRSKRKASTSVQPESPRSSRARSRSMSVRYDVDVSDDRDTTPALVEVGDEDFNGVQVKREPADDFSENPIPQKDYGIRDGDEDEEKEIKKMKQDVELTYKGFGTSSLQLVLIIEPYPPLPASSYAPPSSRLSSRSTSILQNPLTSSRSRSRQQGTGLPGRYSTIDDRSTAISLTPTPAPAPSNNMRNPTQTSSTPVPNSRRGGSKTVGREESSTPGPGARNGRRNSQTPLFMPSSPTPFEFDEEDEEEHEAYEAALRDGRIRLPSVLDGLEVDDDQRRSVRGASLMGEIEDDIPESMISIGDRLVRSSQISEGVVGVKGGWEEMEEGEQSAVMGKEEPGD